MIPPGVFNQQETTATPSRNLPTQTQWSAPRDPPPKPTVNITFDWRAAWQHHRGLFWFFVILMALAPIADTVLMGHPWENLLWQIPIAVGFVALLLVGFTGIGYLLDLLWLRLRLWWRP